jgi:ribosome biogenesis GTPase
MADGGRLIMPARSDPASGKDKGRDRYHRHPGLGRMRRAHAKSVGRISGLDRHADDDQFLDRQTERRRPCRSAEGLLRRFNRLARDTATADGTPSTVCGFDGTAVLVRTADGEEIPCDVRRVLKKMLHGEKAPLCVGDAVRHLRQADGSGLVTAVLPRRNQLERADSHNKALIQVFAANVDYLVIIGSVDEPILKPGLIDRYLVIAHASDIPPLIVINKDDLGDSTAVVECYRRLGYPVFRTVVRDGRLADDGQRNELLKLLQGCGCVLAGQSGVGKSSLVAALFSGCGVRIGDISAATRKGRHTTTSSRSYLLDHHGTTLIDTPGIRECGITGLLPLDVALHYRDIAAYQGRCHFTDCLHGQEPGCAVRTAVAGGMIAASRYDSYRSIVEDDLA